MFEKDPLLSNYQTHDSDDKLQSPRDACVPSLSGDVRFGPLVDTMAAAVATQPTAVHKTSELDVARAATTESESSGTVASRSRRKEVNPLQTRPKKVPNSGGGNGRAEPYGRKSSLAPLTDIISTILGIYSTEVSRPTAVAHHTSTCHPLSFRPAGR